LSQVNKPVILDETGQVIGTKIDLKTQTIDETITAITNTIPRVLEAIHTLDIIYYVEKE